ncbi:MAG TPA: pirin family protein, partial [Casimicrobiaceae bacterium]|nr:pirin family protein [Casimicrobiaceae bacterium]
MTTRTISSIIEAIHTSDGAGVKLRRSLGQSARARLDPFLMLDHFSTDDPDDYIAGFPAHPHRGFETVTYMLDGHLRHEDHLGHTGDLRSGGVQWMTAGRGIVHSEMPQQEQGRMRGFQLWINLPAREKMKPAGYRDIQPEEIPVVELANGAGSARVIAGQFQGARGPARTFTPVNLWDLRLRGGSTVDLTVPEGDTTALFVLKGHVTVNGTQSARDAELVTFERRGEDIRIDAVVNKDAA